ncbi:hypothetical protein [Burkholderia pseudomallei]|uniref:hypothetical protein n=1 Tax=Burkholderia pseudomallei TaxID=28450 RepID=UPI00351C09BD
MLVAWRISASGSSSAGIPQPSSVIEMRLTPPSSSRMRSVPAPASSAFSTSSLTTEAGPLDHFARRDLADQLVGQRLDRAQRARGGRRRVGGRRARAARGGIGEFGHDGDYNEAAWRGACRVRCATSLVGRISRSLKALSVS